MGILLVLVPWGYWKSRVQFYKYTIEYIIEIKKTKTDVQEDNMGHKRIDPPDLDKGCFTVKCPQCSFGLKLIQTLFFVFAPKFYLLHLENITSFKFHCGNSKNSWTCPHTLLMDVFFATCVLNYIKYSTSVSIGSYTSLFMIKFKLFFFPVCLIFLISNISETLVNSWAFF